MLWPEPGLIEAGLAAYYAEVAEWILRHVRLVMDLDPAAEVAVAALIAGPVAIRERLASMGLASFV